jgi:hypothetical protein
MLFLKNNIVYNYEILQGWKSENKIGKIVTTQTELLVDFKKAIEAWVGLSGNKQIRCVPFKRIAPTDSVGCTLFCCVTYG